MKTIILTDEEYNLITSAVMTASVICGNEQNYEDMDALNDLADKLNNPNFYKEGPNNGTI